MSDREHAEALLADDEELRLFDVTVEGATYHEGSSHPWRSYCESAQVDAASASDALIKLATGFGLGAELLPDLPDDESEITITIKPAGTSETDEDDRPA